MTELSPSILSADFSRLGEQVEEASAAGARYIHFDVMDGHFVPNITYGPVVLNSLQKLSTAPFDVHLMIENPERYIESFATEKTEIITVQQETCPHLYRTLEQIKSLGKKAGVAIDPATPIETLSSVFEFVDLILIMSVEPGFGGQSFIPFCMKKIQKLASIRNRHGYNFMIEVDGGVNKDNAVEISESGTDILVAGSAVFGGEKTITENVKDLLRLVKYDVDEGQIHNIF
jgi:ribulose-phosphate 3-epimerase